MADDWWERLDPALIEPLRDIWIAVGTPGFAGASKARWGEILDARFGTGGWRIGHMVRGTIVSPLEAIADYEASYRAYLRARPALVRFLVTVCGNVYDDAVGNVRDADYDQPHTAMNHYQDIAVRRIISQFVDDPDWPDVTDTPPGEVDLRDLGTGVIHHVPRARGFRGDHLLQIREPTSPGYVLNPAVVPVHDPTLITAYPGRVEWYHAEGCGHLSVEAFWQGSKVIEVRLDRFLAAGDARADALAGL